MIEPIVTRKQMGDLLNDVCMRRVRVVDALARIEQWGDDFAGRNVEDFKTRRGIVEKPSETNRLRLL